MAINLYEQPIMPVVDLDSEVVVYVPGYAIKGPGEPTLVNSSNFTSIFGETPYIFPDDQTALVSKNNALKNSKEKSWIYAKGLVDSGLTVLYHRYKPENAPVPKATAGFSVEGSSSTYTLCARSKYFGVYYKGLTVEFTKLSEGVTKVDVKKDNTSSAAVLESYTFTFNPNSNNYLANIDFANIELYGAKNGAEISIEAFCEDLLANATTTIYLSGQGILSDAAITDGFTVAEMEKSIGGGVIEYVETSDDAIVSGKTYYTRSGTSPNYTYTAVINPSADSLGSYYEQHVIKFIFDILEDTETYPVTYLTTGGYFVQAGSSSPVNPAKILNLAAGIKAVAAIDFADELANAEAFSTYKSNVLAIGADMDSLNYSFGFQVLGCDTFSGSGSRILLPDSYGYFVRLGSNVSNGVPTWLPIANNANGIVSSGVATTRPIDYALESAMISDIGVSVNPIIKKKNIGYVIMGNRTLYPNQGVLGPQSFLNCRLVVNSVERSARTSANKLRIVSTNPETAFKSFKNDVSKTCDKFLTAGDGLAEYSIIKLPKTKPATIDIQIRLVVVEGIETFNIYIPYSIALD